MEKPHAIDVTLASTWRSFILETLRRAGDHWVDTSDMITRALNAHAGPQHEAAWVRIPHVLDDLNREGLIERKGSKIMTAQWRKKC